MRLRKSDILVDTKEQIYDIKNRQENMRRRKFTKVAAGSIALSTLPISGCIGSGSGNYTSWLFDPTPIYGDVDNYYVAHNKPSNVPDGVLDDILYYTPSSGELEDTEEYIAIVPGGVLTDFSGVEIHQLSEMTTGMRDRLQQENPQEQYNEYDIYTSSGRTQAVNESEGTVIVSNSEEVTRAVIDTHNGKVESYPQASEDFGLATQTISGGDIVLIQQGSANILNPSVSDTLALGGSITFDDASSPTGVEGRVVYIFPSESSASERTTDVESYIGDVVGSQLDGIVSSFSVDNVAQNGRAVLLSVSGRYNGIE
jgi:hypothetical protein